jgi:hypothetical protein
MGPTGAETQALGRYQKMGGQGETRTRALHPTELRRDALERRLFGIFRKIKVAMAG